MRERVTVSFGKTRNAISYLRDMQFTRYGGPAWHESHANRTASVLE